MKILLINNYHYLKGGVERAYFDTAEILKSQGHEVAFFSMKDPKNEQTEWDKYFVDNVDYNDPGLTAWEKIKIGVKFIFNFQAKNNLERLITEFKPDIAHLHNIYHQLSPSVIYALKKHNIPMVMTLHDYKIISPNYNLYLNGKIWEKKSLFSCIKDKCIKESYLKSAVGAFEKFFHDLIGSYGKINLFISPSRFMLNKLKEFGFGGKIEYIPNPVNRIFHNTLIADGNSGPLVYYGRISKEKGIDTAIRAMQWLENEKLWIIGDGPEKDNLIELAKKMNLESRAIFLGFKGDRELKNILIQAKAIIIPSVWYENMPYCVTEALSLGKIVIASNIGGIPDLIKDRENGFLFKAGDNRALAQIIKDLGNFDLDKIRAEAEESASRFNPANYYQKIMGVYKNAIEKQK
jgi:glycosyltransferase involved in cell wall biosynthesis